MKRTWDFNQSTSVFFVALGTSCEDHMWNLKSHQPDKDIRVKVGRERQRQRRGKRSEWAYGYRDPSFCFYFKDWYILQNNLWNKWKRVMNELFWFTSKQSWLRKVAEIELIYIITKIYSTKNYMTKWKILQ